MREPPRPVTAAFDDAEIVRLMAPLGSFRNLLLAVSGGPDSTALALLVARWLAIGPAPKPGVIVVTVDHGLRPESAAEVAPVARLAATLELEHRALRWIGPKPRSGKQAAARQARYRLLAVAARTTDETAIVTAHTLDDQAETVLMRLRRGSGIDGLAGMAIVSEIEGVPLLRPLLEVPKQRLVALLEEAGVGYGRDPSNDDAAYERVRLRRIMSSLESTGLTAAAIARSARRLQRGRRALEHATDEYFAASVVIDPAGFATMAMADIVAAEPEIAIRALARLLPAIGGQAEPGTTLSDAEKLHADLMASNEPPGRAFRRTAAGCRIVPAPGRIALYREPGRVGLASLVVEPGRLALWDHRFSVTVAPEAEAALLVRALSPSEVSALRRREGVRRLPAVAVRAVPSFWRGGELVAAPHLGVEHASVGATFVHGRRADGKSALFGPVAAA